MSTPVGHILGSIAAFQTARHTLLKKFTVPPRIWWFIIASALLADIDHIALIISPRLEKYIHGPTHSVLFCAALALGLVLIFRLIDSSIPAPKLFFVFTSCAFMHPFQDYLMGIGPPVQFFWPITSKGWLCPVALLPTSYYAHSFAVFIALLWYPPAMAAFAFELAVFFPIITLWKNNSATRRIVLGALSVSALIAIYAVYKPSKDQWDAIGGAIQKEMIEQRASSDKNKP